MIKVYQGTTEIITKPLVNVGRPNLDFGPGFYVTDLCDQAESWALKMADLRGASPIVNSYLLNKSELIAHSRYIKFEDYDEDWLEFICSCRQQVNVHVDYDVIEGGIADDRVINSIKMYMSGYLDAEATLNRLRHIKPNNQIFISDQTLVDKYLKFETYKILTYNE